MKATEMADFLDGLGAFLGRVGSKTALNDLHALSDCFRGFADESVANFCTFVKKAKEGKATPSRNGSAVDEAAVAEHAQHVQDFLDRRHEYDIGRIDEIIAQLNKLKLAEIKQVGTRIGCPLSQKTKTTMLSSLRSWLRDIALSAHQSSFSLGAGASR